jgi:hypothetical protein
MKKIVRLTENDLNKIVNRMINEVVPGVTDNKTAAANQTAKTQDYKATGTNLFKMGQDQIDTNNSQITNLLLKVQDAVRKSAGGNITITVNGGASNTLWGNNAAGSPEALKKLGFNASTLKGLGLTASQLKAAGFTVTNFKAAGYTLSQTKAAGFTDSELRVGGYTVADFKAIGYTDPQIRTVGFTAAEFRAAGYTDAQLTGAGFTDQEIKLSYIITESTEKLTFVDNGSILLAEAVDENGYMINVTDKNMKYFNLVTNAYESYTNLGISTNGHLMFGNISSPYGSGGNQNPINSLKYFNDIGNLKRILEIDEL